MSLALKRKLFCWVALGQLLMAAPALGGVYAYTDPAGVTHFTNVGSDKRFKLVVRDAPQRNLSMPKPARMGARVPRAIEYDLLISEVAQQHSLSPQLLHAVIAAESGYDAAAVSPKGAMGLMQLMPGTARRYGATDPFDPAQNIRGGARYLGELVDLFSNNLPLALAAYNAGEHAVQKHGNRVPPYSETEAYVRKVLGLYARLDSGRPVSAYTNEPGPNMRMAKQNMWQEVPLQ